MVLIEFLRTRDLLHTFAFCLLNPANWMNAIWILKMKGLLMSMHRSERLVNFGEGTRAMISGLTRCVLFARSQFPVWIWIASLHLCFFLSTDPASGQLPETQSEEGEGNASVVEGVAKPDFKVSSGLRFLSSTSAELRWESNMVGPATVAYGSTRKLGSYKESVAKGSSHTVVLDDLEAETPIYYRIAVRHEQKRYLSDFFTVDSGMNYRVPTAGAVSGELGIAGRVLDQLETSGGIAVMDAGLEDSWASALLQRTELTVIAVCDSESELNQLRKDWYERGQYGVNFSAQLRTDLPKSFANLVIVSRAGIEQAGEWLSPSGAMICVSNSIPDETFYQDTKVKWLPIESGIWSGSHQALESLAEWGHQYGSPANASFVGETLNGVDDAADLEVRWLGRPGADFGIDRNPRMPAPLAVGGRLFHQGMNRMIALDAFNGAVLWSLELPNLRRVNIPRDSGNWCADESQVYAAVGDCLWVIDAASGEMLHTVRPPEGYQAGFDWGYVAVTDEHLIGTVVSSGGSYSEFWSKPGWYDGINDTAASKVCGRSIMVYDKKYGDLKWKRDVEAVLQSTITIHDGNLYFVEVVEPSEGAEGSGEQNQPDGQRLPANGRLPDSKIWPNSVVVCLDLETGTEKWKVRAPTSESVEVIAFGVADDSQFVLETSSRGKFHLTSFDSQSGDQRWQRHVKWSEDNHGGHMQHAVLMSGQIFLQPHILDAASGEVLKTDTLGKRRGCATPIGAGGSIIYRGGSGPVTLWSLEDEATSEFARLRPSCWLSTIPAQGMLFSPEAGGGCSCGGWMECSIGFAPVVRGEQVDNEETGGKLP